MFNSNYVSKKKICLLLKVWMLKWAYRKTEQSGVFVCRCSHEFRWSRLPLNLLQCTPCPMNAHIRTTSNIWPIISRTLNFSQVLLLLFWLEPCRLAAKNIIQMKIVYFAIFMLFVVSTFWILVYNFSTVLCFSNSVDFIALFLENEEESRRKMLVLSKKSSLHD